MGLIFESIERFLDILCCTGSWIAWHLCCNCYESWIQLDCSLWKICISVKRLKKNPIFKKLDECYIILGLTLELKVFFIILVKIGFRLCKLKKSNKILSRHSWVVWKSIPCLLNKSCVVHWPIIKIKLIQVLKSWLMIIVWVCK